VVVEKVRPEVRLRFSSVKNNNKNIFWISLTVTLFSSPEVIKRR